MSKNGTGYVGIDKDYFVSVKEVLNITAETGALETQDRVRELPSADVVEVRHAKDIGYESSYGWKDVCSLCGCEFGTSKSANYCPNCGARIDGEEQENERR